MDLDLIVLASLTPVAALDENYFEWIQVAPIVVSGESHGKDGKQALLRVERVIRGELREGETIRVRLKVANRERDRELHRKKTELDPGVSYVLLLKAGPPGKDAAPPSYDLVRGVEGVRALPAEGATPLIEALETFVELQQLGHRESWARWHDLLGASEAMLVDTSLQMHVKFRRGDAELLADVRPLLDHPQPRIREGAAALIAQILDRHHDGSAPEDARLRSEITARARRDPVVDVRIAAIRALDRFDGPAVLTVLDEIADDDPDQRVRYTAEALAYERRTRARPGAGGSD